MLLCIGLAAFVFQLWTIINIDQDESDVKGSKYNSVFVISSNENRNQSVKTTDYTSPPLLIDYSILPDLATTIQTKKFFESLYTDGYIGKHDSFQQVLRNLKTKQILSNMLLRDDELTYLNTVKIRSNMLSMTQIQNCNKLVKQMLQDLKTMYMTCKCNSEQKSVINLSMGRLIYLTQAFENEFNKFSLMDPLLLQSIDPAKNKGNMIHLRRRPIYEMEALTAHNKRQDEPQEQSKLAKIEQQLPSTTEPSSSQHEHGHGNMMVVAEAVATSETFKTIKQREPIHLD